MNKLLKFMIGDTMTWHSKIVRSLLVLCIVLQIIILSKLQRSKDFHSFFVSMMDELPQPSKLFPYLLDKNAKAEAEENALVEKVKGSILPSALKSKPYNLSGGSNIFFSQGHQDELMVKMMKRKVNGIFFEAGALDGERYSNTLHLERVLGWTGLLVEPGKKSFDLLKQKGRKARLLHAGLSPNLEASEMRFDSQGGNSPLAKLAGNQSQNTNGEETVICYPLYTILQAMDVPVIDYLSLDIEGNELKVLKTVPWERVKVRVLGVEILLNPEGPEAMREFLEQKGFVFYMHLVNDYIFYHPDYASELDLA